MEKLLTSMSAQVVNYQQVPLLTTADCLPFDEFAIFSWHLMLMKLCGEVCCR